MIDGASTSASESVPNSASIVISAPGVPGVTAESGPSSGGYFSPLALKNSGVAPLGATPSPLIATIFPVFGL